MSILHAFFRRHRWRTDQRGGYGRMESCRCGASRVVWSRYFSEKYR